MKVFCAFIAKEKAFQEKRKQHYNEYLMAKRLSSQEDDDEDDQ
jgi:hypothetical protein